LGFLRFLWMRHRVLTLVAVAALAFVAWETYGFVSELIYFAQAEHIRQPLELWMSPRYVAKSWDLPREVILEVMDLQPDNAQPTLRHVIEHLGITLPELEERVRLAADRMEAIRRLEHMGGGNR
jgi:hypothetical protein